MKLPNGLKLSQLQLIGQGIHGQVYRINQHTCIKIYKEGKFLAHELANLLEMRREPWFPKVIKWGKRYMIREYIEGIQLDAYLEKHPLEKSLSRQLVAVLNAFKRHRFPCRDIWLKNLIVTPQNQVRVLDLVHVGWVTRAYPQFMLEQLKQLGYQRTFLQHVKSINPALYQRWKFHWKSGSDSHIVPKGVDSVESSDHRRRRVHW